MFRIRIHTDPHEEMPPGEYRTERIKVRLLLIYLNLYFIYFLMIFNIFNFIWKNLVENILVYLVFTSLVPDPDPYGHFWDPGSESA